MKKLKIYSGVALWIVSPLMLFTAFGLGLSSANGEELPPVVWGILGISGTVLGLYLFQSATDK